MRILHSRSATMHITRCAWIVQAFAIAVQANEEEQLDALCDMEESGESTSELEVQLLQTQTQLTHRHSLTIDDKLIGNATHAGEDKPLASMNSSEANKQDIRFNDTATPSSTLEHKIDIALPGGVLAESRRVFLPSDYDIVAISISWVLFVVAVLLATRSAMNLQEARGLQKEGAKEILRAGWNDAISKGKDPDMRIGKFNKGGDSPIISVQEPEEEALPASDVQSDSSRDVADLSSEPDEFMPEDGNLRPSTPRLPGRTV